MKGALRVGVKYFVEQAPRGSRPGLRLGHPIAPGLRPNWRWRNVRPSRRPSICSLFVLSSRASNRALISFWFNTFLFLTVSLLPLRYRLRVSFTLTWQQQRIKKEVAIVLHLLIRQKYWRPYAAVCLNREPRQNLDKTSRFARTDPSSIFQESIRLNNSKEENKLKLKWTAPGMNVFKKISNNVSLCQVRITFFIT